VNVINALHTIRLNNTNFENIAGSSGDEIIYGDNADNKIGGSWDSNFGNNTMAVGGSDTVYGLAGNDTITAGGTIYGGAGNDTIVSGSGNDTLDGGTGTDTITSGTGSDTIIMRSGDGNATLANANVITDFTDGTDLIQWESAILSDVSFTQGSGSNASHTIMTYTPTTEYMSIIQNTTASNFSVADFVNNSSSAITANGGGSADIIKAGAGNDTINGNGGNDTINGGSGNDTIIGGLGIDSLTGDGGSDIYKYTSIAEAATSADSDKETIFGFDATDNSEVIQLFGLLTGTFAFRGNNAFTGTSNTEAKFDDTSKLLTLDIDGDADIDMEIKLDSVALSDLDNNDFAVS